MLRSSLLPLFVLTALLSAGCGGGATATPPAAAPCAGGGGDASDGLDKLTDEQLARKILEVTGAGELGKQIGDSMLATFRKMPNLPPGFIERVSQNMHFEALTDLIVPIYMKHYDRKTMMAAIRFYKSDPGKTLVQALPAVTAESMEVGKTWGAEVAKKTLAELGVQ
jgi:uncharacterized protein